MGEAEERVVQVCSGPGGSLALACRVWAPAGGESAAAGRVVAWPGRLDNVGAFDALAPRLAARGCLVVAVDPPGAGRSQHRSACDYYNDFDEALLLIEIADVLWGPDSQFVAAGHAEGGAIAAVAAAAFPHRALALVVLESSLSLAGTDWADGGLKGFEHLNAVYRADRERRSAAPLAIADLDGEAAAAVLAAPAAQDTARALLSRQFREADGHLLRTIDTRLQPLPAIRPQCVLADEATVLALMRSVECPTLVLHSTSFSTRLQALGATDEWLGAVEARLEALEEGVEDFSRPEPKLDGRGHYFLSDASEATTEVIAPWLEGVLSAEAEPAADPPQGPPRMGPPARGSEEADAKEQERVAEAKRAFEAAGGAEAQGRSSAIDVVAYGGAFRVAARHWPAAKGAPSLGRLLCYSGWLDNTGSFVTLAPLLSAAGFDVIAIDAPGAGLSAHLPPEAWYRTEHEAVMVMEAADALGWTEDSGKFSLLAHSRGTSVCQITACAFPERIARVVLVESRLGYMFGEPAQAAATMRNVSRRGTFAEF